MIYFILKCVYLILPGIFANSAPVIFKNMLKKLAIPVDLNTKINGKPVFGKNKTYRGFFVGIISSIIIAYIQSMLYSYDFFSRLSFIDYSNWLLFGFLIGAGVLFGDLIGSFIKRRIGISSGESFVPLDQLSAPIGAILFISVVYVPSLTAISVILVISFIFHILFNHIGYYLKLRKKRW